MKSNQIVKIILASSLLLFVVGILFYLMYFKPKQEMVMFQEKNKIEEIEKQKESDQKKIESCLSNSDKIKAKIENFNKNPDTVGIFGLKFFNGVFYSSKANACVYVETIQHATNGSVSSLERIVRDVSTDNVIDSALNDYNSDDSNAKKKFNEIINEYKD